MQSILFFCFLCSILTKLCFIEIHAVSNRKLFWSWEDDQQSGTVERLQVVIENPGGPLGFNINIKPHIDVKGPVISNIQRGSPGERAGLQQWDIIRAVNGADLAGWDMNRVVSLLQRIRGRYDFRIERKSKKMKKHPAGGQDVRVTKELQVPTSCHAIEMEMVMEGNHSIPSPSYFHSFPCLLTPAGGGTQGGFRLLAKLEEVLEGIDVAAAPIAGSNDEGLEHFPKALIISEEQGVAAEEYALLGLGMGASFVLIMDANNDQHLELSGIDAQRRTLPPVLVISSRTGQNLFAAMNDSSNKGVIISIVAEGAVAKPRQKKNEVHEKPHMDAHLEDVKVHYEIDSHAATMTFDHGRPGLVTHNDQKHKDETGYVKMELKDMLRDLQVNFPMHRTRLCNACNGRGARPMDLQPCPRCRTENELGTITHRDNIGLTTTQSAKITCPICQGYGERLIPGRSPCNRCKGGRVTVENVNVKTTIPKGAPEGHAHILAGEGSEKPKLTRGDIILIIESKEHPDFERDGADLYFNLTISVQEAFFGFERNISTLNGTEIYLIQTGMTRPNTRIYIDHAGLPRFIESEEDYYCKIPNRDGVFELWKFHESDPHISDENFDEPDWCEPEDLYGDMIIDIHIDYLEMNNTDTDMPQYEESDDVSEETFQL